MVKTIIIILCLQHFILSVWGQADTAHNSVLNKKRLLFVAGMNAAFYTGSFIVLNKAWYDGYAKSGFHFFNDNPEWNQIDKAGHVWSTYHISRASSKMWAWTGLPYNTSSILGGVSGMLYQSIIEIQDAYSSQWGFSWGDVGANIFGAGLFVLQDIKWKEQKITVKMSYWPARYSSQLLNRRNELFGNSGIERILKDYNSQTYWLSANISSIFPSSDLPEWLNISFGYGAGGMYGGRSNRWVDKEGNNYDYRDIERVRKFYVSPDIDLTRIRTKNKFLRSVFYVLNVIKVPAPALELKSGGGLKVSMR